MGEKKHNYIKDILRIAYNTSYKDISYYDLGPILLKTQRKLWVLWPHGLFGQSWR